MIRVFELFRKSNLINMSATLIQQYTAEFNPSGQICPSCGAKHPDWKRHGIYLRNLIMFEDGSVVPHLIAITRFRCSSCGHTHAMLPSLLTYVSILQFTFHNFRYV